MPASPGNDLDQEAQTALAQTTLALLTADPATIKPFTSSALSWKVTVPNERDVAVTLDLAGVSVATSGQWAVSPESTQSYQLRARAGRYSKILGTVIVSVDMRACIALSDSPIFLVTQLINNGIKLDKSGLYFQHVPFPSVIGIAGNKMIIRLLLAQDVKYIEDPKITIDASFELGVVVAPTLPVRPGAAHPYAYHQLAPANEVVNVDVSFATYLWLVPGAMIFLPIESANAQRKAQAKMQTIISEIVSLLNGWFVDSDVQPPKMDKHDASFYVNPQGDQRFWVTFCPVPLSIPVNA